MTTNIQQSPYLRQQRDFPPDDSKSLAVQVDRAYVDIAIAVNDRTIGTFALGNEIATGESWYLAGSNSEQQTLRQVYIVTGSGNIAHGITTATIAGFTRIYGTFSDGTNFYPLPYTDSASATNQVQVVVTPTNIVITAGGGAPAITSGFIVLEWLSQI